MSAVAHRIGKDLVAHFGHFAVDVAAVGSVDVVRSFEKYKSSPVFLIHQNNAVHQVYCSGILNVVGQMERMLSAGFVEQYVVKAARGVPRNVLHTDHQAFKNHITRGSVGGVAEQAFVFIMSVKVEIPIVQNVARCLVLKIEIRSEERRVGKE